MNADLVYLAQTDTTVGFLSQSAKSLTDIKNRPSNKQFISSFTDLALLCKRIPKKHKKLVRNSKRISFILPKQNFSFRLIQNSSVHGRFLRKFNFMLSTSANESGGSHDIDFAFNKCDIAVLTEDNFIEKEASKIIILGKRKRVKIRG